MAVPKRKLSRARKKMKRMHKKLTAPALSSCPQCKEKKKPHHICPNCGYYNGKEVIKEKVEVEEKKEK